VDAGYFFSERRGVARASDLAALAGVQELPESRTRATAAILEWARRNGYEHGVDGVTVEVRFFCGNSLSRPPEGICENTSRPLLSNCTLEEGCDALEVTIRKPMQHMFSRIFGVSDVHAGFASLANVKFNVTPIDAALLLDGTASMREVFPDGSRAIDEARIAAHNFTDILLDASDAVSSVAFIPYRDCVSPPRDLPPGLGIDCVHASEIIDFTEDADALHDAIEATQAGGATNICMPFLRALEMFEDAPGGSGKRFVVLLSDGDNEYTFNRAYGEGEPPSACRPDDPEAYEGTDGICQSAANPGERDLDQALFDVAREVEEELDAEVYVVGLSVCGNPSDDTRSDGYCAGVGNGDGDNVADRRLLRCIASSSAGTNDHYFEIAAASELPPIFQKIAYEIVGRGLAEQPPP
jgi:hypothetical protein